MAHYGMPAQMTKFGLQLKTAGHAWNGPAVDPASNHFAAIADRLKKDQSEQSPE
jgi:hypothetical protein